MDNNIFQWQIDFDDESLEKNKNMPDFSEDLAINFCIHEWAKYEGFTDAYEYCTKCDTKNI